jgi:hypothetical protein
VLAEFAKADTGVPFSRRIMFWKGLDKKRKGLDKSAAPEPDSQNIEEYEWRRWILFGKNRKGCTDLDNHRRWLTEAGGRPV